MGDLQPQGVYSVCSSRPAFPTGPSISLLGGGGGGGGGQQAFSLSIRSKHKLWNFHRYSLVYIIIHLHTALYVTNNDNVGLHE